MNTLFKGLNFNVQCHVRFREDLNLTCLGKHLSYYNLSISLFPYFSTSLPLYFLCFVVFSEDRALIY